MFIGYFLRQNKANFQRIAELSFENLTRLWLKRSINKLLDKFKQALSTIWKPQQNALPQLRQRPTKKEIRAVVTAKTEQQNFCTENTKY